MEDLVKRWVIEYHHINVYDLSTNQLLSRSNDFVYEGNRRCIFLNKKHNEFRVGNNIRIPNNGTYLTGLIYNIEPSRLDEDIEKIF